MRLIRTIIRPFKKVIVWLARCVGFYFLPISSYQQILSMRRSAVQLLVDKECLNLNIGLTCIIFSKDRALQLYALLDSYFKQVKNPAQIYVIYHASSVNHELAYREVESIFSDKVFCVTFCPEIGDFRETFITILAKVHTSSIFFLVDDIVFISPVDFSIVSKIKPTFAILSLRHSPHITHSYTMRASQDPPKFGSTNISPDLLTFNWFESGNEWSDPWSLDGQIFSTAEIRVLTLISEFKGPNSYESALKTFNDLIGPRLGLCFNQSKILNLPVNRVQVENLNLSADISPEFLLKHWNDGLMIDLTVFDGYIPSSPHEVHNLFFRRRA
jgi:hypothetical protein